MQAGTRKHNCFSVKFLEISPGCRGMSSERERTEFLFPWYVCLNSMAQTKLFELPNKWDKISSMSAIRGWENYICFKKTLLRCGGQKCLVVVNGVSMPQFYLFCHLHKLYRGFDESDTWMLAKTKKKNPKLLSLLFPPCLAYGFPLCPTVCAVILWDLFLLIQNHKATSW